MLKVPVNIRLNRGAHPLRVRTVRIDQQHGPRQIQASLGVLPLVRLARKFSKSGQISVRRLVSVKMFDRARRCLRHLTHPEFLCVVNLDSVVSKCGPSSGAMNCVVRRDHFCPFFRHHGAILRIGDVDGKFSHVSVCYFFHARSRLVVPVNRVLQTQSAPRAAHRGPTFSGRG